MQKTTRTPPPEIDLDPTQYREINPPRRPNEPFFSPGGLSLLAYFIVMTGLTSGFSHFWGADLHEWVRGVLFGPR